MLLGQPEPLPEPRVRLRHVLGLPDDVDHFVDVVDGDLETLEDMLAVLRPLQLELGAPHDHDVAVLDEVEQDFLEVQLLRHAVDQGEHDGAEGGLHLRVGVQLVQHDHGDDIALQLDDEPDPLAVGLVPDIRDPFELLREHQVADLLVHALGTHLVGELADDDVLLAGGLRLLGDGARPQHHPAAALLIALLDAVAAVNDAAGGKIGPLDEFPEVFDAAIRVVHQVRDRLHHLAEIVRRDVRRHAHRDAGRAIDDQVREAGGEHGGLLQAVVEVGNEDDRVLVDVLEHRHRDAREPGLGVAVRRCRVAVHRAEIPLPIDERVAQREVLHHAHQRVVQRHVAVRVVLAEHVADDGRALFVGTAGHQAQLVHRVEDAAVDRLQAVAHIGQRALHDDAHRIVEERFLQLVFDEAGKNALADVRTSHVVGLSGIG